MLVFGLLACLIAYESHVESVELNNRADYVYVRRYRIISCNTKTTYLKLSSVIRVHAAKCGLVNNGVD
jgi:hypothetical protein